MNPDKSLPAMPSDMALRMVWRVCVRPQRYGRWAVERPTTLSSPAFARNVGARRASDEGREVDAGVE
mgnify:CR=1 FL=1